MTKFFTIFAVLVFLTAMPAQAEISENFQRDVTIKVDGMVCDFCAQSIKKVFGKQEAVQDVDVDLDAGEIVVDLKDGQTLDDAAMEKMVKDSGYNVTDIVHADASAKTGE